MMRLLAALLAFLLLCAPASAQLTLTGVGGGFGASAASYAGPGDVVSGATAWYGLRAYNAAYATGSNNAINIRRASDNTTTNIVILANGKLDIATANTFAGTDATCQGSTTGLSTTIAFTSCSSTPNALDTVTGAGISQPESIVSCGSFVAGAGTCTLTTAQNIAVAETVTMQVAMFVTETYDQSGANACSSAPCNATQATAANQPQLLPSCINSLPCMQGAGIQYLVAANFTSLGAPVSVSSVFDCTGTNASNGILGVGTSSTALVSDCAAGGSSTVSTTPGGAVGTASQGVWHSIDGDWLSSGTPFMNVDGVVTTGTSGSPVFVNSTLLAFHSQSNPLVGRLPEEGLWPIAFNSTQYTNLCKNKQAYYGAGNFGAAC